ncbi:PEGA domain-containing protein [Lutibacter sp.]|uniref:PEGA domain-containing protein n=1 Tax=Lutibacter sp. TaxID=1925666 RepID=UPI0025C305CC|nr:PEGA domain-containing protein [Lutibacter sp.]MCF6168718.1 PEGA domain-containing protein [Lutibacter sp.]
MKNIIFKLISFILISSILLSSCSSATIISSIPSQSKLYVNGEFVGKTPYKYKDFKIVGATNTIRLEKEGYDNYISEFSKDEEVHVGAMIGGFFLLVPFLWVMKYKKAHLYELRPIAK